jgi:nitroimidazol reductase NimA-like FMN-containing flavoprotein (pyridoxamine 5'-phosphate oxidase superfamily)
MVTPERTMSSKAPVVPEIRDLSQDEIVALLERNDIGRLAFSFHDSVDIRPLHYVHSTGWLFGRTSPGDKLVTLRHNQWIAFETDEVSGPSDWASVIIHGAFYHLEDGGSMHEMRLYDRAVRCLRRRRPDALTEQDPLAFQTAVFGIQIESMTGRSSSTGATG